MEQLYRTLQTDSEAQTISMRKRSIKILVVDDHPVVRRGIISLLSLNKEFDVVGEAADGQTALRLLEETDADLVLLDIAMPGKDGYEVTRDIRAHFPRTKILILSGCDSSEAVQRILTSGAHGYLLKTTTPEELYTAIKAVVAENAFFSPEISKIILEQYTATVKNISQGKTFSQKNTPLSKRECEILRLIALGKTHREIAKELNISVRTVDTHRTNIMRKTNLHDTASLVRYALQHGIISVK